MVEAPSFEAAITISHVKGLNPGGEIQTFEITPDMGRIPAEWVGRLLTREEAENLPPPS